MSGGAGRLEAILQAMPPVAVAVSGGVDSMTLAVASHRLLGKRATMAHAVSPAVPERATQRVREWAESEGWKLYILDAGEFNDENYLANPIDRCFFCKGSLYGSVAARLGSQISPAPTRTISASIGRGCWPRGITACAIPMSRPE
jgi:pyridinium-3,5-biscarboxylic acid mononucleotide sulfurtransferase